MSERPLPPTGERSRERGFDPAATAYRVERLSRRILGQHPEVESPVGWAALDQLALAPLDASVWALWIFCSRHPLKKQPS